MEDICIITNKGYKIPVPKEYVLPTIRNNYTNDEKIIHMNVFDYVTIYLGNNTLSACIFENSDNTIMEFNKKKIKNSKFVIMSPECAYSYLHGIALAYNKPIFILPNEYYKSYANLNTAHVGYEIERKWLMSSDIASKILDNSLITSVHEITQFVDNDGVRYRQSIITSNTDHIKSISYVKCIKGDTSDPIIRTEFEACCTEDDYNKAYKRFKSNRQYKNPVKKTRYHIMLGSGDNIELNFIHLGNKNFINLEIEYESLDHAYNDDLSTLLVMNNICTMNNICVTKNIYEFTGNESITNKTLMKLDHKSSMSKKFCKYVTNCCPGCLIKK